MSFKYSNDWDTTQDSDDEVEQEDYHNSKEATLFLIEATHSMLSPTLHSSDSNSKLSFATPSSTAAAAAVAYKSTNEANSKMEVCLRMAYAMMRRKVISSPKDFMGIMIFNTHDSTILGIEVLKNINLLYDLKQLTASTISSLKAKLTECENDPSHLEDFFRPDESGRASNIGGALDSASALFSSRASKLASKRIILITDNDDPVKGNEQLIKAARKKRGDLGESGIVIETYFIPPSTTETFDLDTFYGEIIGVPDETGEYKFEYPEVENNLNLALTRMISVMRGREAMKRVAFSAPFLMAPGVTIGIKGYCLVNETKKREPVKMDRESVEEGHEVYSKTVYNDVDGGGLPLDPVTEIKSYFQFGTTNVKEKKEAARILLEPMDVPRIKTLGVPPGLKLLGFEPRETGLKFQEFVAHSYFIYPDEERYAGSTQTFASLLHTMLEKDVIAYGWLIARPSSRPQIVLLLPQAQVLDAEGNVEKPNGIHLIQLPFADDMRSHSAAPIVGVVDIKAETCPPVDIARDMVRTYTAKKYAADQFPNPALNHFYDVLAAVALDDPLPIPVDTAKPNYNSLDKALGDKIETLHSNIKVDAVDLSTLQTSSKRKDPSPEPIVDSNAPPPDFTSFIVDFQDKEKKITNDKLKAVLRLMGLSTTGVKDVLYERVQEYLEEKGLLEVKHKKKKTKSKAKEEEDQEDVEMEELVLEDLD